VSTPLHPHEIKNCNCGAKMFFAPSAASKGAKKVPVDADPVPHGNIFLNDDHHAVVVSKKNPSPEGATLYLSHFATCPHSAQYRTKKES
jgi:hypothetical protein